jgi:hypothetical protein
MINRNPIEIQEIEKTYRKIIDDEIKQKIIWKDFMIDK